MNVEASELMGQTWVSLEGHVVNDAFPLRTFLGGSDHSGVFLSEFTSGAPSPVALKLVPATGAVVDSKLSLWFAASVLDHPHLLRLLDAGRCQVDGLHYVYAVMEYADQNLAQLLEHRALTEDEAREMLVPTLQALAHLHGRGLVQGRLKPSNILVVGDGLRLASDTIRPVGEVRDGVSAMSVYEPPEAREGTWSGAGDVWALGVTLCEALTRRQPSGLRDGGGRVVFPPELSPAFRELIERCVSRRAEDRPSVAEIEAWVRGEPLAPASAPAPAIAPASASAAVTLQPAETIALLEPAIPEPVAAVPTAAPFSEPAPSLSPKATRPAESVPVAPAVAAQPAAPARKVAERVTSQPTSAEPPPQRRGLPFIVGAVVVIAVVWVGARLFRTNDAPTSAATSVLTPSATGSARDAGSQPQTQAPTSTSSPSRTPGGTAPAVRSAPPPLAAVDPAVSTSEVHREIPDVPRRALQTIRGTVRVSVRVIVNQDGTVFAALTDQRGPSRYFERLSIEAAKKWAFSPSDSEAQRIMIVRFAFTRAGTTARAVPVR